MKAMLLRVGIDKGSDGLLAPLFKDGTFEYIPLSEKDPDTKETRTFQDLEGGRGPLSQYLPDKVLNRKIHHDPEFDTFTYTDQGRKALYLTKLDKGDYLVFYAGLTPWEEDGKDGLYLIGYLVVEEVLELGKLDPEQQNKLESNYPTNSHLKRPRKEGVVLVVGNQRKSKLLGKALSLSSPKLDKRGRAYHAVSQGMEEHLGIKGSIQRSIPPRFIEDPRYLQNLLEILEITDSKKF
jgi:hypothetical protein